MASTLTLDSWPQTTGFDTASYFNRFLEQMQFGMPSVPGVLPTRTDDILGSLTNEFKPFGDSSGMQVKVYQGRAVAKGIFARVKDADAPSGYATLTVTAAHATLYRVDSIIVRYDLTTGVATLRMLDGTAAASGSQVPTALTQSATTWDVLLGYVFVTAAVSTIAAADVCDQRVFSYTLDRLAAALSIPNPIINGGFPIWNDGTTFTSIADATYGPEMWLYLKTSAVVHDLLRSTDVPAVAQDVGVEQYSCHLDVTTADASVGAGDYAMLQQRIEGRRARRLLQRGFTLAFWVKDTIIGPHAVAFANSIADRSFVAEYFITQADTWELHYVHVPASPTAGTWDYDTGIGLRITFPLIVGSTYQTTTPGAWQSGSFLGTARTVNSVNSTSNNFKLAMVGRMSLGGIALPFAPHDDELALTQRYYRVWGGELTNDPVAVGWCVSNAVNFLFKQFDPPMRTPPTMTVSANSDWGLINAGATVSALNAFAATVTTTKGVRLDVGVASGMTAAQGTHMQANSTTNARLKANSRL